MCLNLGLHAKEEVEQLKNLKGKFIAYKLLEVDFNGKLIYRTREDARKAIRGWNFYTQIWKVEIDPKDIVAIGYCFVPAWSSNKITSIVTHKAKLLERVR
jgi:proline racemase